VRVRVGVALCQAFLQLGADLDDVAQAGELLDDPLRVDRLGGNRAALPALGEDLVVARLAGPDRLRAQQSGLWDAVVSCAGNGVTYEWAGRDAGDERRPWEPFGAGKSLRRQMSSKSLLLRCTLKFPSGGKAYSAYWLVAKAS